jgi:hypothetical protein
MQEVRGIFMTSDDCMIPASASILTRDSPMKEDHPNLMRAESAGERAKSQGDVAMPLWCEPPAGFRSRMSQAQSRGRDSGRGLLILSEGDA